MLHPCGLSGSGSDVVVCLYGVCGGKFLEEEDSGCRQCRCVGEPAGCDSESFTPKVSAGTYAYSNFGRAVDPETNTYISSTSFNNGYSVDGSITLFDGFSALNNIKISNIAVKMGISQEQKLRDEICLSVMEAYYNVLFHTQMVEVMESQIEAARSNLTLVKKQLELGQKGRADVVQMEADLADREYQLINSRNQKDEAVLTLKALMLWPVEEVLPVDMSAVRDSFELPEICMESAAEITSFAHENNPAVRIAKGKWIRPGTN